MTPRADLMLVTLISAFTFGVVLRLVGALHGPLAGRPGMDDRRAGTLESVFNLVLVPMMLVCGLLVDHLGIQEIIIIGSFLAGMGVFALALARTYRGYLYAIFLLGISEACLCTGAVVLMPQALVFSNEAASANLGYVFFGLGALVTPALVEVLLGSLGLRKTLCLAATLCLAPALSAVWTSRALYRVTAESGSLWQVGTSPVFWVAALTFLVYCPLEGALGVWSSSYLTEMGYQARRARFVVAGFWLSFLGSRLFVAFLQQREIFPGSSDPWLICFLAVLATVVLGNLAGTTQRGNAAAGLFVVGALLGPVVPTLVGCLFEHFPDTRGTAFGAMFALGAGGSLLVPPFLGAYARRRPMRAALVMPTFLAILLAGSAMVLALQ